MIVQLKAIRAELQNVRTQLKQQGALLQSGKVKVVVTDGSLNSGGVFIASEVLARHDETYIPIEVVEALKKSGKWKGPVSAGASTQ